MPLPGKLVPFVWVNWCLCLGKLVPLPEETGVFAWGNWCLYLGELVPLPGERRLGDYHRRWVHLRHVVARLRVDLRHVVARLRVDLRHVVARLRVDLRHVVARLRVHLRHLVAWLVADDVSLGRQVGGQLDYALTQRVTEGDDAVQRLQPDVGAGTQRWRHSDAVTQTVAYAS